MRILTGLICIAALSACGDSKFADMPQSELQERYSQCENASSLSPGGAITCDNIRRECERRAEDKGRKVCY
ncbi:MAG: hypothetical protein CMK83_25105 [Pseudomonadales bacterium]|jgi:predicted O-methyltransferase YrrM|uniref:hypothetical protein n=1 Tax=unclassified Ketobacter TaxID=2639109 RepID=UPI000C68FC9D|nr:MULTISPECIES: hypothetical protein [unclassified Ketobacter]MAA60211.1 hypothetical protein [Pseudomonadales bacterium]MEC8810726.1 hypothetical protein [Pseudomonadota bacterium]HAG94373.1 hypothetical protein [Gammaproteobacteria bacterium]MAQ27499.1 hypothetical protein [Pseudomonadales bacterium]MBI26661.1 hypothetical protein [Pseudomonadales bacterium]